jgi:hypothetical protein
MRLRLSCGCHALFTYYLNALIVQSQMSGGGRHLRGTKVFVVSLLVLVLARFEEA